MSHFRVAAAVHCFLLPAVTAGELLLTDWPKTTACWAGSTHEESVVGHNHNRPLTYTAVIASYFILQNSDLLVMPPLLVVCVLLI